MTEKYTLQFPFTSATGEHIAELRLRRLKVKDMRTARRASDKPEEWDEPLMAAMTGLVPEDLSEMDLLDYQALQKRFQSMLSMATEPTAVVAGDGVAGEVVSLSAS
ncbi:phage tail assembly protein [Enterobacter cloacae]|uniref:phage tail assembly protein n=1 Tax=Enterobacter TaxID=547 RepID=UPI00122F12BE|nr:phage tail assembly protein [Enterobacter cloacae]HAS0824120.1 phage tail assembly protein [Enterobacter cloacae subsp. cloacae]EKT9191401.1 phage tail assembly protein [Enterobacter cloacae]EKU3860440.1 phage tail assembly protein [Enterobacter cloacae]EKX4035499.1 phage tail assembly protein [Enterobacter cloacae]EKX9065349.1 phage tail assembly protein [Enterobacter cloacae]